MRGEIGLARLRQRIDAAMLLQRLQSFAKARFNMAVIDDQRGATVLARCASQLRHQQLRHGAELEHGALGRLRRRSALRLARKTESQRALRVEADEPLPPALVASSRNGEPAARRKIRSR